MSITIKTAFLKFVKAGQFWDGPDVGGADCADLCLLPRCIQGWMACARGRPPQFSNAILIVE